MAILLNSSKTKISNNSHKISLLKLEKDIEEVVFNIDKEKSKKLSFLDIGYCLSELRIFRELFQNEKEKAIQQKKFITYKKEFGGSIRISLIT